MRHFGKVINIEDEMARIQIAKSSQCKNCTACDMFDTKGTVEISARNELAAKVEDYVEVEIAPAQVIGSSLLVFIFPIIALIIGYMLGSHLAPQTTLTAENAGIIGSLIFLVLAFLLIYVYDRLFARKKSAKAWIAAIKNS